jgi:uncharacterized membrane protein
MNCKVYSIGILYFLLNKLPSSPHTETLLVHDPVLAIIIAISLYDLIVTCRYEMLFYQIQRVNCANFVEYVGKRKISSFWTNLRDKNTIIDLHADETPLNRICEYNFS